MPTLENIPVSLTPEELVDSRGQREVRRALLQDAEEAIALGQTLWQPRALYDWFEVRSVDGEDVVIATGDPENPENTLHVGRMAHLLAKAQQLLVSVWTIGPALEQHVHELITVREGLKGYMLDTAGVLAVGAAGEAVRCLAEETAAERGWGVSPSLSPGSLVGWTMRGQRELCALLPMDAIGVRLNSHHVLEPHKSTTAVIGMGPGYDTIHVGSACKYCALSRTCWRRRGDPS